jgi:ubiquinone/menaquinone biosynthesis C-methylase UbiE
MFLRKFVKWIMPHGMYVVYKTKKLKQAGNFEIIHRSRIESVVLADEATKNIGKDWVSNRYYDEAEKWLPTFWSENTIFYKNFCQLDCTNIVELACGHGRHIQKYLKNAKSIFLVDINQENIDFCKKRYSDEEKIKYLVNNGNNFNGIGSNSQTAVFSYDAMVHFELIDILEYLKESNRILRDGGKILFHHSNAAFSPELSYGQKPHARNFMSADIFAYLAIRTGFIVLEQNIFSWGGGENFAKDIDCLSLCQKIKTIV